MQPKTTASERMMPSILMGAWLLTATLITVLAAPAVADKGGPGKAIKLDSDGDGKISLEEFKFTDKKLMKIDADGDGAVSASEMAESQDKLQALVQERMAKRMAAMEKKSEQRFAELDSNDDGSVTADEVKAHAFSRLDKDDDGFLTRKELRHGKRAFQGRMKGDHGDRRGKHGAKKRGSRDHGDKRRWKRVERPAQQAVPLQEATQQEEPQQEEPQED